MSINFEAIEKAWFKPKKTVLDELEEYLLRLRLTDIDGRTIVYRLLDKIQELKKGDEINDRRNKRNIT